MNVTERKLLTDIRDGMVTLAGATTALLEQSHPRAPIGLVHAATEEVAAAAKQVQMIAVAADGFTPVPEPIPQPAPLRPTPDNPSPPVPTLTEAEQEIGKVWRINDTLRALGIQIKSGGAVEVNWEVFVRAIGASQAADLSVVLEEVYGRA